MTDDNKIIDLLKKDTTKKKTLVSTQVNTNIDCTTGEVTSESTSNTFITSNEPDYVKVYLNTMCAFKGLSTAVSPVLLEFCKHMSWANDNQVLRVDKFIKEEVARAVGLKVDRINQILRDICNSGIFIKEKNYRGVYRVNPFFIAKGDWSSVRKLRGEFNFKDGTFNIVAETEDAETENKDAETKTETENKDAKNEAETENKLKLG